MFNNNAVKQKFSVYKVHSLEVVHQHWYTVWAYGCGWTSSINWNALPTGWSTQLTTRSLSRFECKTSGTMVGVWRLVWGFTCCPVWQTKFNRTTELKSVWPTQHQWAQQSLTCTTNFSHYYAWLLKAAAYLYRHNSVCVCVCVFGGGGGHLPTHMQHFSLRTAQSAESSAWTLWHTTSLSKFVLLEFLSPQWQKVFISLPK